MKQSGKNQGNYIDNVSLNKSLLPDIDILKRMKSGICISHDSLSLPLVSNSTVTQTIEDCYSE